MKASTKRKDSRYPKVMWMKEQTRWKVRGNAADVEDHVANTRDQQEPDAS